MRFVPRGHLLRETFNTTGTRKAVGPLLRGGCHVPSPRRDRVVLRRPSHADAAFAAVPSPRAPLRLNSGSSQTEMIS